MNLDHSMNGVVLRPDDCPFPAGTLVYLKGGSPTMTSLGRFIYPPNTPPQLQAVKRTACAWFQNMIQVGEAAFPDGALMMERPEVYDDLGYSDLAE